MDVPINYPAVLLAAASSMPVGAIWYLPGVFGRAWTRHTGVDPMRPERPLVTFGLSFLCSLLTAYVLAYVTSLAFAFHGGGYVLRALLSGLFLWAGFTAARLLIHDLFERRPLRVFLIAAGHELVTVAVMAVIIGLLRP